MEMFEERTEIPYHEVFDNGRQRAVCESVQRFSSRSGKIFRFLFSHRAEGSSAHLFSF